MVKWVPLVKASEEKRFSKKDIIQDITAKHLKGVMAPHIAPSQDDHLDIIFENGHVLVKQARAYSDKQDLTPWEERHTQEAHEKDAEKTERFKKYFADLDIKTEVKTTEERLPLLGDRYKQTIGPAIRIENSIRLGSEDLKKFLPSKFQQAIYDLEGVLDRLEEILPKPRITHHRNKRSLEK